ncbi:hypothetical protein [Actinoplanes sp. NPDC048796]|uniref:hypothetical protein n=1 Tax=Actinoplanes sp. NPDC048796 TaxID=3155640 RepID=UPI0033CE601D
MKILLQSLPALIGVLLGALATFFTSSATERARWHRQQSIRWDEKRLTAYTEYANAVKHVISTSVRLASARGVYPDDSWLAGKSTLEDLVEAEEQRTLKWEAVLLLGDENVIAAGRDWHQLSFRLMRLACSQPSELSWEEVIKRTGEARHRFYVAAKGDLGVHVGESTDVYEWQMAKWLAERPEGVSEGGQA